MRKLILSLLLSLFLMGCITPNTTQSTIINANTNITRTAASNVSKQPKNTNVSNTSNSSIKTEKIQIKPLGNLKVSFLDVGQADSVLVQTPNNKTILIDTGNNNDYKIISSYLSNHKINEINVLIGTHPHEDHIGSMASIIKNFKIDSLYMPKITTTTKIFENTLKAIKAKNLKITTPISGKTIDIDKDIKVEILAPNSTKYEDLNNYSIVLKLTYKKTSFLFGGDASAESEKDMLSKKYDVKADVLKVGHHGSASATTAAFLKAVNPKYAVISVGKGNDYGHPTKQTLNRLASSNVLIFRTDFNGTIVATSDGNTIKFDKKASPVKAQAPPTKTQIQNVNPIVTSPSITKNANNSDINYYITRTGAKYHLGGCRYLSKSQIPIKLSEAKSQGYTPCSACNPPK